MPTNRSLGRNVHFYNAAFPEVPLGGLRQNGSVTQANFLYMLKILIVAETPFTVHERRTGQEVAWTNTRLEPGSYDVSGDGPIQITNEFWVHRILTRSNISREDRFRDGVRDRDGRCVLSGTVNLNAPDGGWNGFHAAHIFPLHNESCWNDQNYGRWIRDVTPGVTSINSRQNGFLLRADIHADFDDYVVSVNPDDGYKIIVFGGHDVFEIDGRSLDFVCRDPANIHRVSDELLRWHFRQSVLANMRGEGEPVFEHDFPGGNDAVAEIGLGPRGSERLGMEIAARLPKDIFF
ncbi:hypothetical protein BGX38DRAFT_1199308 [Terfezia claveryi]|nr:hypothetical protein BGX38DRAFT_1199308 [Terfezia claveryi]